MKKLYVLIIALAFAATSYSQDTFSIIALDTVTGEIGGAGASCIDDNAINNGVLIINDIIPGRGGIHTQAYWRPENQENAHDRMMEGMSPDEIIHWLVQNDVQNNPSIRQYGIVDFDSTGNPRSAAHTGKNCDDYKDHILGPNYAIQGNILQGQHILDSMEARFLNTDGMLAEKLMAALQGANIPGADTRCTAEGVSSLSAFVRVAKPSDTSGSYFCDLLVPETPYGVEPIDSLQVLFDEWMTYLGVENMPGKSNWLKIAPNPVAANEMLSFSTPGNNQFKKIRLVNSYGVPVAEQNGNDKSVIKLSLVGIEKGIYLLEVTAKNGMVGTKKVIVQ
ncbi:MAG: DUF1028 domain-containing protein [Bacteroidales bacterium]|nr:DUF1028 domain-containing protein [Bacteroidales bacterium]